MVSSSSFSQLLYICLTNVPPAFSALRAYALSNRSAWSAVVIIALALPPVVMHIVSVVLFDGDSLGH